MELHVIRAQSWDAAGFPICSLPQLFQILGPPQVLWFCYRGAQTWRACKGIAMALQSQPPVSMQLKLWHLFFPLQQDMAVPPGSAAAYLEEHPAWTEQKLTRTSGAGSGYAGSRPRGIFAFQFQTGNYKRIQLTGSMVWEDAQRRRNREMQKCWWRAFPPLKCMARLSPPEEQGQSWFHSWDCRAPVSCSHLRKRHWALQGRQVGGAGKNVSTSSFSFLREDTY